jgi:hypothetical protein
MADKKSSFLSRLLRLFVVLIHELLYKCGLWSPELKPHAHAAKEFQKVNQRMGWKASGGKAMVLVEGHLAEYGPNYMFRTALAAKAMDEALGGAEIVVVVDGYSHQWQTAKECYRSFGIEKWIFLGGRFILRAPWLLALSLGRACHSYLGVKVPRDLVNLRHGNIKVGDLIYDQILRSTKSPTITAMGFPVFLNLVRSWYYYEQYRLLLQGGQYSFYVATHTAYPQYGLLCRVALDRKVKVIETTDIQMSLYSSIDTHKLPTYHQGIHDSIRKALDGRSIPGDELVLSARRSLERRFNSELDQIDALKAYSGKVYERGDLLASLGTSADRKIGFVLSHVFVDSPHLSSSMLHNDYYDWLVATIDACAQSENMVWIIKPHPSSALYGEEGMVERLVRESAARNVFVCPPDLNTRSLATCSDVIVTVHGTAGLEFACLGKPVILAGTPFYAGFGFAHEPQTQEAFRDLVIHASMLEPLTPQQVRTALEVFAVWESVFDWNNPIITSELLANVWGNGTPRNLERAFEILTRNLESTDPRKLKLWNFAQTSARHG